MSSAGGNSRHGMLLKHYYYFSLKAGGPTASTKTSFDSHCCIEEEQQRHARKKPRPLGLVPKTSKASKADHRRRPWDDGFICNSKSKAIIYYGHFLAAAAAENRPCIEWALGKSESIYWCYVRHPQAGSILLCFLLSADCSSVTQFPIGCCQGFLMLPLSCQDTIMPSWAALAALAGSSPTNSGSGGFCTRESNDSSLGCCCYLI